MTVLAVIVATLSVGGLLYALYRLVSKIDKPTPQPPYTMAAPPSQARLYPPGGSSPLSRPAPGPTARTDEPYRGTVTNDPVVDMLLTQQMLNGMGSHTPAPSPPAYEPPPSAPAYEPPPSTSSSSYDSGGSSYSAPDTSYDGTGGSFDSGSSGSCDCGSSGGDF